MSKHKVKILPLYFEAVISGVKTFERRSNKKKIKSFCSFTGKDSKLVLLNKSRKDIGNYGKIPPFNIMVIITLVAVFLLILKYVNGQ